MTSPARKRKVRAANTKMTAAWDEGRKLLKSLGARAESGAMIEASRENISEAERLRRLRRMASCLKKKDVQEISKLCRENDRVWGPQYLVALSRLTDASKRKEIITLAMNKGWGLIELQRAIRVELAQSGISVRRNRQGTGRRRKIDWSNTNEVSDEVQRMCVSWANFRKELESAAVEQKVKDYLNLLPEYLHENFKQVSEAIDKMLKASEPIVK